MIERLNAERLTVSVCWYEKTFSISTGSKRIEREDLTYFVDRLRNRLNRRRGYKLARCTEENQVLEYLS